MSSDGSSGITQFGLYRTIDARTEEFLRLSKKRQIRQGCACAVISTAITVTVVVSVLLVYEYNIISGSSKNNSYVTKPNWLGFINDSADTTPFDSEAKPILDKTTIKLLPILLKALKQNIFFEKVIEDPTSSRPIHEPIANDITEQKHEKNIFPENNYRFRTPTSRLYAIEFKSSPIVYYQPMRNLEYMAKIRKIRDYKRILNYFEKMISDKVTSASHLAMTKRGLQIKKPYELSTTPKGNIYKLKQKHSIRNSNKNIKKPATETQTCKCPLQLGELLKKWMSNINQLLPYSKISSSVLCGIIKSQKVKKTPPKVMKNISNTQYTTFNSLNIITTPSYQEKLRTTTDYLHLPLKVKTQKIIMENYTQNSKDNLLLGMDIINAHHNPNYKISTENYIDIYEKQTTVKNYLEPTESRNIKLHSTKSMTFTTDKLPNFIYPTIQNDLTSSKTTGITNELKNRPIFSNEEYDEYFSSTQKTGNSCDATDVNILDLIKTKVNFPHNNAKNKNKSGVNNMNKFTKSDISIPSLTPVMKFNNNLLLDNNINSIFLQKLINSMPELKVQKDKTKAPKIGNSTEVKKLHHVSLTDNQFGYDDKSLEEKFLEEYKMKLNFKIAPSESITQIQSTRKSANNSSHKIKEYAENNENLSQKAKSMIPNTRPVYLEIQRNDWKQDDNHDYAFNMNNNLYDFPNI